MVDIIDPEKEWQAEPDGSYILFPLLTANAKVMNRGAGYLLMFFRSPSHEKAVRDGLDKAGTIQLHLTAQQCRIEATRLIKCAEELEAATDLAPMRH